MTELASIEKSIIKKYRKEIWSKFIKSIKQYDLIKENDKIAVCLSGGKDSMLMAKCFQELKSHNVLPFEIEFLLMDPGYQKKELEKIKKTAKHLNLNLHIFQTNIFTEIDQTKNACYLCAKKRRGYLYYQAKKLGCNKIALGHHLDDVAETILLNLFYNGQMQTMPPKLKSKNFENIELIRPMYLIEEKDILKWQKTHQLTFCDCACQVAKKQTDSKRYEMKQLIIKLEKTNPKIKKNLLKATENVNLDALLGYKKGKKSYKFY